MFVGMPAYFNPSVLKRAREQLGISFDDAASNICTPAELKRVEDGNARLTFKQLILIAYRYEKPLSYYYLKEPPGDDTGLENFRSPDSRPILGPRTRQIINEIKEKREFCIDYIEEGKDVYRFDYYCDINGQLPTTEVVGFLGKII